MLGSLFRRLTGHRSPAARAPATTPTVPRVPVDALPVTAEAAPETDQTGPDPGNLPAGGAGKSPVFSSRAVRDATVVTGAIESLTRFVGGQDVLDDLTWRLESLSNDQVNFLQLSAEPGLIQRALNRSETMKGAKAAALRKLLGDLAGGAIPEPVSPSDPLDLPKGPIVPPLTSLQPRSMATLMQPDPTNAISQPAGTPSLTTAPPLATRPIPPAPAKPPVAPALPPVPKPAATSVPIPESAMRKTTGDAPESRPLPPRPVDKPSAEVSLTGAPLSGRAAVPLPESVPTPVQVVPPTAVRAPEPASKPIQPSPLVTTPEPVTATPRPAAPLSPAPSIDKVPGTVSVDTVARRPAPEPSPAAKPVEAAAPAATPTASIAVPSVPRLGRQDAEARRARLMASLTDTLSSSEASP